MKPFRHCGSKFLLTNRKMLYAASFIVNTILQIVLLNILVKYQSHSNATLTRCTLFVISSFKIFYDYMYNFRICLSYSPVTLVITESTSSDSDGQKRYDCNL